MPSSLRSLIPGSNLIRISGQKQRWIHSKRSRCDDHSGCFWVSLELTNRVGFWGTHVHACPALRPRWVDLPWPYRKRSMLPSGTLTPSAPPSIYFRGSITQPTCSLSTLHRVGRPSTAQDSLPARWLDVNGTGLSPVGFRTRISRWWPTPPSDEPDFPGALVF